MYDFKQTIPDQPQQCRIAKQQSSRGAPTVLEAECPKRLFSQSCQQRTENRQGVGEDHHTGD